MNKSAKLSLSLSSLPSASFVLLLLFSRSLAARTVVTVVILILLITGARVHQDTYQSLVPRTRNCNWRTAAHRFASRTISFSNTAQLTLECMGLIRLNVPQLTWSCRCSAEYGTSYHHTMCGRQAVVRPLRSTSVICRPCHRLSPSMYGNY